MITKGTEILIHAFLVHQNSSHRFDFVLNQQLKVRSCLQISQAKPRMGTIVKQASEQFKEALFEIGHIRVNPELDNQDILERLKRAFSEIGVKVSHQPKHHDMAMCYKPLGELSDIVRFYLKNQEMIFLSPSVRPKLIVSNPLSIR